MLTIPVFWSLNLKITPQEQLYLLLPQCGSFPRTCQNTPIIQLNSFTKSQVIILYFSCITVVSGQGSLLPWPKRSSNRKLRSRGYHTFRVHWPSESPHAYGPGAWAVCMRWSEFATKSGHESSGGPRTEFVCEK